MSLTFSIYLNNTCSITLTGAPKEFYLEDSSTILPYNQFKYKDTAAVTIIELNKLQESKIVDSYIIDHNKESDDLKYTFTHDGYHIVYYIVLPTKECIDKIIASDDSILEYYDTIYAIDGNSILKMNNDENWVTVEIDELLRNPSNTNINIISKEVFSICFLWECYINYCKEILSSKLSKCSTLSDDAKFNRDVVWMAINVIKYYLDKEDYESAELVLEEITGCNGFCSNTESTNKKGGCGCGR